MSYLIVSDNLEYKIACLTEAYKNHIVVTTYPDGLKRKFSTKHIIYELEIPDIEKFANQISQIEVDTSLLFELLEDTSSYIPIQELARLYFGESYTQAQMTALLIALSQQKIDFDNHEDGSFKKSTHAEREAKQLVENQAAIEAAEFEAYYNSLHMAYSAIPNHEMPQWLDLLTESDIIRLVNKPDRSSIMFKAIHRFCTEQNVTMLELLHSIGKIPRLEDFFVTTFMQEHFPKGPNHINSNSQSEIFPFNPQVEVFSIDDSTTTEIDDAFSVQATQDGYIIGVHISAPALDPQLIDNVVSNISTIYYPCTKLTMLHPDVIAKYSLDQGTIINVVSIYFKIDSEYQVQSYESKVESIKIKDNLRIETLEQSFNSENLDALHGYPYEKELKILFNFANKLEEKRGKPSVNNLFIDYNFSFDNHNNIVLTPRLRGRPIDKLVSELMILANCTWGRMLTNAFIPAIYRVKQTNFPVKMTLTPASHTGLNVDYYTWSTSPLRRSVDFINQHQIISLVTGKKDYFPATHPDLLEVVENFDNTYSKYIAFQDKMEKYWSLKYLIQKNISDIEGTVLYKSRIQLNGVPLEINAQGITRPKATQIKIKVFNINLAKLSFEYKILD